MKALQLNQSSFWAGDFKLRTAKRATAKAQSQNLSKSTKNELGLATVGLSAYGRGSLQFTFFVTWSNLFNREWLQKAPCICAKGLCRTDLLLC